MAQETEIKLKVQNVKAFLRAIKRLRAKSISPGSGRIHESNVIFDTPQGGLAQHGQLLRVRVETPETRAKSAGARKSRAILTFKTPPGLGSLPGVAAKPRSRRAGRHKVREEIEVAVADAAQLQKVFEGLGLRGWFRYEKYRTTYRLPAAARWAQGLLIELDETPVGTFVELEGSGDAIDRAANELGYSTADYVLKDYLSLYAEDCRKRGEQPRDMLFPRRK
jgi:adenylate cyclase class 2